MISAIPFAIYTKVNYVEYPPGESKIYPLTDLISKYLANNLLEFPDYSTNHVFILSYVFILNYFYEDTSFKISGHCFNY